jgi:hypothetical protein
MICNTASGRPASRVCPSSPSAWPVGPPAHPFGVRGCCARASGMEWGERRLYCASASKKGVALKVILTCRAPVGHACTQNVCAGFGVFVVGGGRGTPQRSSGGVLFVGRALAHETSHRQSFHRRPVRAPKLGARTLYAEAGWGGDAFKKSRAPALESVATPPPGSRHTHQRQPRRRTGTDHV